MTRNNELHPLEVAAVAALAVGWAVLILIRALLALLLVLTGPRPAPRSAAPQPVAPVSDEASPAPTAASEAAAPLPQCPAMVQACAAAPAAPAPGAIAPPPLEGLTVAQLRRLARAAGLPRALSHSGRRAQLLAALAAA